MAGTTKKKTKPNSRKSQKTTGTKKVAATQPPAPVEAPKRSLKQRLRLPKRATKAERAAAKAEHTQVPSAFKLLRDACMVLVQHWRLFAGILIIYALLVLVLVGGVSGGTNLEDVKKTVGHVFTGEWKQLGTGLTLFAFLIGSTGNPDSAVASAYQTILLLLISVVLIWALRQVYANHAVRVREAFYTGTYPIVPFILVLCVVGLQLLPLVLGTSVYGALVGGGIAVTALEQVLCAAIFLLLALWSAYMVCSSLLALYIVTLPGMTPMKALHAAKDLVRFRRWIVLRKLLFLPIALLVVMAIIVVPFAVAFTAFATALFFVLSILGVGVIHSYMYALYRSLL